MTTKISNSTIQKWGNSLAVRIPAAIAHIINFHQGTPIEMVVQENRIIVRSTGERKLTLEERLKLFDLKKHGGEVMASKQVGLEEF